MNTKSNRAEIERLREEAAALRAQLGIQSPGRKPGKKNRSRKKAFDRFAAVAIRYAQHHS